MISHAASLANALWRNTLPVLSGPTVTLREVEVADAASLLDVVSAPEVTRFLYEPPNTIEAFEQFIDWCRDERRRGRYVCFAVVPHGMTHAVGLFHIRRLDLGFNTAEWGFVIDSAHWGTGLFRESAELVLDFIFTVLGVTRLEARVAMPNGRANTAMRKLGAVQEAVLRKAFSLGGECMDQALWAILDGDRADRQRARRHKMYVH
jgi:[ribosomal protein S5]-alanine N-acetyltransferase